jgi:hypothetical protein
MFNEGTQIHNLIFSSGSGTVMNYGSGSDFTRVVDPDPGSGSVFNRVYGSGSVFGIRIRIQEGKNDPQKRKKLVKVHVFKCWMASFEN